MATATLIPPPVAAAPAAAPTPAVPPPARGSFASLFPSDLLVRIVQHFHAYGLLRDEGRALSRRLIETNTVYDLPAAKSIEQRLSAWADGADRLLAEAKAGDQPDGLAHWVAELKDTLLNVRLALQIPVERAAAAKEQRAREGFAGSITMEEFLRERLHNRPDAERPASARGD